MIVEQVLLPCECVLSWSADETQVVLCPLHTREYIGWHGDDEGFIKSLTVEHTRQMKMLDKGQLEKLR